MDPLQWMGAVRMPECHQSPQSWQKHLNTSTSNSHHSSPSINVLWSEKLCVCKKKYFCLCPLSICFLQWKSPSPVVFLCQNQLRYLFRTALGKVVAWWLASRTRNRKDVSSSLGPAGIFGGGSECTAPSPPSIPWLRCPWARHWTPNCSPGAAT